MVGVLEHALHFSDSAIPSLNRSRMETADQEKNRTTANDSTEIEQLKQELQREHEMYLRALADYDNYRRRVERERSAAARSGKRE